MAPDQNTRTPGARPALRFPPAGGKLCIGFRVAVLLLPLGPAGLGGLLGDRPAPLGRQLPVPGLLGEAGESLGV